MRFHGRRRGNMRISCGDRQNMRKMRLCGNMRGNAKRIPHAPTSTLTPTLFILEPPKGHLGRVIITHAKIISRAFWGHFLLILEKSAKKIGPFGPRGHLQEQFFRAEKKKDADDLDNMGEICWKMRENRIMKMQTAGKMHTA